MSERNARANIIQHRRSASLPNGNFDASTSPISEISRIPIPNSPRLLRRQGSVKMRAECRPPTISEWEENKNYNIAAVDRRQTPTRLQRHRSLQGLHSSTPLGTRSSYERDDDQDSVSSMNSTTSSICEHAHFARNGTTYSARKMKYIVHCSSHAEKDEYLTPTQRASRSIRRLRTLLAEAQTEIMEKESEIVRLTRELVELRLNQVDKDMPDCPSGDGLKQETLTVCEREHHLSTSTMEETASTLEDTVSTNGAISPQLGEMTLSLADSGHFEDLGCSTHALDRELDRVKKNHDDMREKYQDKVESLLKKITETNDKFYELKPEYDAANLRIQALERENETLKKSLQEQEDLHRSMVQIYSKEKDVALNAVAKPTPSKSNQANQTENDIETVHSATTVAAIDAESPPKLSISDEHAPKILQELEITRRELEDIKVHLLMPSSTTTATLPTSPLSSKKRVKSKLKSFKWKTLSKVFRSSSQTL